MNRLIVWSLTMTYAQLLESADQTMKNRLSVWKYRYGEEEACKRFELELKEAIEASVTDLAERGDAERDQTASNDKADDRRRIDTYDEITRPRDDTDLEEDAFSDQVNDRSETSAVIHIPETALREETKVDVKGKAQASKQPRLSMEQASQENLNSSLDDSRGPMTLGSELKPTIYSGLEKASNILLPTLILTSIYTIIYALTSSSMADLVAKLIGSSSDLTKYAGYGLALVIDLTVFMLIGTAFQSGISFGKRFLSGVFGILLMAATCASAFVSIDGRSELKALSRASSEHQRIKTYTSELKGREKDQKAIYYQMVYGKNWAKCLESLGAECKIRGYRTREAVEAKTAWERSKEALRASEAKMMSFDSSAVAEVKMASEQSEKKRTQLFVIGLWCLALIVKWYQKSVVPERIKDLPRGWG